MNTRSALFLDPAIYLNATRSDAPVWFFSPRTLAATAQTFLTGFPGLVTYAVKANPTREVLDNLINAGVRAFDVASPAEMMLIETALPGAAMHYNNPVRSRTEIETSLKYNVTSYSVDDAAELAKLGEIVPHRNVEVAVRLRLPVKGANYDFGAKFGADPERAVALLAEVVRLGFRPAMTFHPGTQCADPEAWVKYIRASAEVAARAGVVIERLNVGGGFPSLRAGTEPEVGRIFDAIGAARDEFFAPGERPDLVCEPGRAIVAAAFTLGARVKSRRDRTLYLNDGIYGGLSEAPIMGDIPVGYRVVGPDGLRTGEKQGFIVFGPTCDSLDRLPGEIALPVDTEEEDFVLFPGLGAYAQATTTGFNGYGHAHVITVAEPMP